MIKKKRSTYGTDSGRRIANSPPPASPSRPGPPSSKRTGTGAVGDENVDDGRLRLPHDEQNDDGTLACWLLGT